MSMVDIILHFHSPDGAVPVYMSRCNACKIVCLISIPVCMHG